MPYDDLIQDIIAVCLRHGLISSQVIAVFGDMELMGQVVKTLEAAEGVDAIKNCAHVS